MTNEEYFDEEEVSDEEQSELDAQYWEEWDDTDHVQNQTVVNVFQKTNRILAEDEKISVVDGGVGQSIGMANVRDKKITLDLNGTTNILKAINRDSLFNFATLTKAVNYHELAHLLFTDFSPKQIKDFVYDKYQIYANHKRDEPMTVQCRKWKLKFKKANYISGGDFKEYLNILEDLRIERLFAQQYPRAKYYFSFSLIALNTPIHDYRSASVEQLLSLYALWYGRRHLFEDKAPLMIGNVRKILEQKIPKKIIKMVEEVCNAYIVEVDVKERLEIAYFLTCIFDFLTRTKAEGKNSPFQSSSMDSIDSGRSKKPKDTPELTEQIKEEMGEEKESKGQELDEEKEEKKTDYESGDDIREERKEQREENEDLAKQIKKIIEEMQDTIEESLEQNESFKKEVEQDMEQITGKQNIDAVGTPFTFGTQEQLESGRIELLLRKLRGDLSVSYQRYESRGKIDVPSFIRAKHNQDLKMFARRTMNKIALARLGVSFIIDSSGSIGHEDFVQEMKAVYCFTRALEKLQNKVEVIEFSSFHRTLKSFNQTGDWKRTYNDQTYCSQAIKTAIKDLNNLKSSERVFNQYIVIVTDGSFNDRTKVEEEIQKAHSFGIKLIWIFVGRVDCMDENLKAKFDEAICISKFTDLSQKMNTLINRMQREVVQNIQRRSF